MKEMRVGPWIVVITALLAIIWVAGMAVRMTARWIPWEEFFVNIPYMILGLVLAHVTVHFVGWKRKDPDDQ